MAVPEATNLKTGLPDNDALLSKGMKGEEKIMSDVQVPNIIEHFDSNYFMEASKIDLGSVPTDPTDYVAMRKWLQDSYMKTPKDIKIKRIRTPVPVHIKDVPISYGANNHFRIRIYDPTEADRSPESARPALMMIHGGGWIHGFPEVDEEMSKFFASELRAIVVSVDYRLAPEHPFPASRDDCYEALNWIFENAKDYNIDTTRIAVWGCSSGGNLAASLALKDSAQHENARIRHVNLVAPVTCHPDLYPPAVRSSNASMKRFPFGGKSEESEAGIRHLWDMYAGDRVADPHVSVLTAEVPPNHPAVHVTVAGIDGLRDEGIAYALHLRDGGVDMQLDVIPGVPHGINVSTVSIAAEQCFRNQVRSLNTALNMV